MVCLQIITFFFFNCFRISCHLFFWGFFRWSRMTNTSNSTLGERRLILEVSRKMNCVSDTCGGFTLAVINELQPAHKWAVASRRRAAGEWTHGGVGGTRVGLKKKIIKVSPCLFLKVYTHTREFYQSALLLIVPAVNTIPQVQTFTRGLSFPCESSCCPEQKTRLDSGPWRTGLMTTDLVPLLLSKGHKLCLKVLRISASRKAQSTL